VKLHRDTLCSPPWAATEWTKNFNRLTKYTVRFLCKFAVKWILKVPPHLAYVGTLPCETLMSAKKASCSKLQGSVATYLRCGGVVNNQIRALSVFYQCVGQVRKVHETITFFFVTLPIIHWCCIVQCSLVSLVPNEFPSLYWLSVWTIIIVAHNWGWLQQYDVARVYLDLYLDHITQLF